MIVNTDQFIACLEVDVGQGRQHNELCLLGSEQCYMIRDPLACDHCFHLILAKSPAPSRDTTCASINLQTSFAMSVHHTYLWIA